VEKATGPLLTQSIRVSPEGHIWGRDFRAIGKTQLKKHDAFQKRKKRRLTRVHLIRTMRGERKGDQTAGKEKETLLRKEEDCRVIQARRTGRRSGTAAPLERMGDEDSRGTSLRSRQNEVNHNKTGVARYVLEGRKASKIAGRKKKSVKNGGKNWVKTKTA